MLKKRKKLKDIAQEIALYNQMPPVSGACEALSYLYWQFINNSAIYGYELPDALATYSGVFADAVGRTLYTKYGQKPVSQLVLANVEIAEELENTPDTIMSNIGGTIATIYGDKWCKVWNVLMAEYNPIHNYDRHEEGEDRNSGKDTDKWGAQTNVKGEQSNTEGQRSDTIGSQDTIYGATETTYGSKTMQYGATQKDTISVTNTDQNDVSAFNVSTYSPKDKQTHVSGPTQETEQTHTDVEGSHTDNTLQHTDTLGQRQDTKGQQVNVEGQRSDTIGAKTDEHEKGTKLNHTLDVTGNIGVMSTQDMIGQEIDLRTKNKFLDIVCTDIANEICSHVYTF